ncbi:MAG TPA: hypothetical protein VFJ72_09050 [Rubrobacteraceae bacterium]|nr:hypothetical protein [Rubrobacteraceae bacterium]
MNVKRILISSDLRSYREAVAEAFRQLRPDCDVFEAESGDLNREVLRLHPDLVVCSQATSLVRERVRNWVELYPDCEPYSVVSLEGERSTVADMQLSDLLSVVDRTEHHAPLS